MFGTAGDIGERRVAVFLVAPAATMHAHDRGEGAVARRPVEPPVQLGWDAAGEFFVHAGEIHPLLGPGGQNQSKGEGDGRDRKKRPKPLIALGFT